MQNGGKQLDAKLRRWFCRPAGGSRLTVLSDGLSGRDGDGRWKDEKESDIRAPERLESPNPGFITQKPAAPGTSAQLEVIKSVPSHLEEWETDTVAALVSIFILPR